LIILLFSSSFHLFFFYVILRITLLILVFFLFIPFSIYLGKFKSKLAAVYKLANHIWIGCCNGNISKLVWYWSSRFVTYVIVQ
jgi:hypothetical protein